VQSYVGNGLLFHMTQLTNRSNTKSHRAVSKPTVSDLYLLWRVFAIHLLSYFKDCMMF